MRRGWKPGWADGAYYERCHDGLKGLRPNGGGPRYGNRMVGIVQAVQDPPNSGPSALLFGTRVAVPKHKEAALKARKEHLLLLSFIILLESMV